MHYPENSDTAAKFAISAFKRMQALGIPAHPRNFAIWYEYVAGKNADLKGSVDKILAEKKSLGDEDSADLYERFILAGLSTPHDREWSERIDSVAERIFEALSAAGNDTANYGAALETFSGGLAKADDIGQIRELVLDIIEETNTMDAQSKELKRRVQESAAEVAELRQALEDSRRDALTDGLTGVANRKCFDQELFAAVNDAEETAEPLSLIFADLDHFKQFNDNYGHALGDQVLRLVGKTLHNCVKGKDTAARYGGEEFAIILPDTSSGGATVVAENIRKTVASKKLVRKGEDGNLGIITMSLGVTAYVPGEPVSELMERADKALYLAKKLGRNRVICEDSMPAEAVSA